MDRTYSSGAAGSAPAAPASPSSGYPTAGNPGTGTPATKPGPYWYHMIMEELMAIITAAAITPAQGTLNQLLTALRSAGVFTTQANTDDSTKVATTGWVRAAMANIATAAGFVYSYVSNGYIKFPSWLGGFIIQWGSLSVTQPSTNTAGTASASFPIAFPNSCLFMIGVPNGVDNVYTNASASALTSSTYQAAFISQLSLTRIVQWIAFGR